MPVDKLPPHTTAKPLRDVLEIFQCRLEHDVPTGLVVQARLVDEGDLAESIAGRSVHSIQHVAKLSGRWQRLLRTLKLGHAVRLYLW